MPRNITYFQNMTEMFQGIPNIFKEIFNGILNISEIFKISR